MPAISSKQYDPCERCNGEGSYTTALGAPGTEPHTSWGSVEGKTVFGPYTCGVCLGTGFRKPRRDPQPQQGKLFVHSSRASQMSFDDIFDAMKLPTQTEEPHEYQEGMAS